jgi:hypothetical protein
MGVPVAGGSSAPQRKSLENREKSSRRKKFRFLGKNLLRLFGAARKYAFTSGAEAVLVGSGD